MIARVVLWSNGMVMTFNVHGEQLSDYQGRLEDVRSRILTDAPSEAKFAIGDWQKGSFNIDRELWARFRYDHAEIPT